MQKLDFFLVFRAENLKWPVVLGPMNKGPDLSVCKWLLIIDESSIMNHNYDIVQQPFDLAFFSVSAIRAALVNTS